MNDACNFTARHKETVMVMATIRAVASACSPEARLIGNIRCDDIVRAIDALMPLDEFWPGETKKIKPTEIYCRRDWRDGAPPQEVVMGLFAMSMNWEGDAVVIGPLTAKEVVSATYHAMTGQEYGENYDPDIST